MAAQENAGWIEVYSFPIDGYTSRALVVEKQMATASDASGVGVTFAWAELAPLEVVG